MTESRYDFDEYIRQGEPDRRQKAENWQIAIGLQAVDGLKPSRYLIDTAQKHIEGELDIETVKRRIDDYYKTEEGRKLSDDGTDEADKVAANIADLLSENAFTFASLELSRIHRRLFSGVLKHAGEYRNYNISKKEWVLDGDSVVYAPYELLRDTIEFDFEQEKCYSFSGKSPREIISHICKFISGLWEIHPFREGNTRTTAVFTIKYLQKLGFKTSNDAFKQHAWYFRNALVRANYTNALKGISSTTIFLERFFENILLGASHELRNRFCHIYWKEGTEQTTSLVRDDSEITLDEVRDKFGINSLDVRDNTFAEASCVRDKIISLMEENPRITLDTIAESLHLTRRAIEKQVRTLRECGAVERVGANKNGSWKVKE